MAVLKPHRLAALAVGMAAAAPVHTAAGAGKPCWQGVIADWTNGGIQRRYSAACYAEALRRLPTDVRMYSDAASDIHRDLLIALRKGPTNTGGGGSPTGTAAASATRVPLTILVALTLTLTAIAAAAVARLRGRRAALRSAPAPPK